MQRPATQQNSESSTNHAKSFRAVLDSRKRKIRGLWIRGERYYAQIRIDLGNGRTAPRRIALEGVKDLDEAKAALEKKRTDNRAGTLPSTGHRPKFDDFAKEYMASATFGLKKLGTRENEEQAISRWIAHLGGIRLDKITAAHIKAFRSKRLRSVSIRTANMDVGVINNVLRYAKDERELITTIPEVAWIKPTKPRRRRLPTTTEVQALLDACDATKNTKLFRYYLQFLAYSGAREQEALLVTWQDVDLDNDKVRIPPAKNDQERFIDLNSKLRSLLEDMQVNRPPDSKFLFPSPQRGNTDRPAKRLRESLSLVRIKAGLEWFAFHHLRVYFASHCVMAGIDFMTISKWLGHGDGGVLVGKTYGDLVDKHKKEAALKVNFGA